MGSYPSAWIAYGVPLYTEGWATKEHKNDYCYVAPWEVDEVAHDEDPEVAYLRFLVAKLPQDPYLGDLADKDCYELGKYLKKRTGLHLLPFGHEGGRTFLASGPAVRISAYDVVDISKVQAETDEEKRWMQWAIEQSGVTFTAPPKLYSMVSYG